MALQALLGLVVVQGRQQDECKSVQLQFNLPWARMNGYGLPLMAAVGAVSTSIYLFSSKHDLSGCKTLFSRTSLFHDNLRNSH